MNCLALARLTSWECSKQRTPHGDEVTTLTPPVSFWDGTVVPVFLFERGAQVEITDDGGLLEHLHVSGFKIGADARRRKALEKAVGRWHALFTSESELQVLCKADNLAHGLQRYLGALFAVAQWEAENAGKPVDNAVLMAEAEFYLLALNPNAVVARDQ